MVELVHEQMLDLRGGRLSLDVLAEAYYPWLQSTCFFLTGHRQEGQDLAQEVMALACRHAAAIREPNTFRSWLREVARNQFTDWLRRKRREEAVATAIAGTMMTYHDPSVTACERFDLQSAMAQLPLEQRTCLVLYYFLGLRYREIAEVMQCPIGTVMSRLSAARKGLRRRLEVN